MIITPPQALAVSTAAGTSAQRYHPTSSARSLLPDSTPAAPKTSALGANLPEGASETDPRTGNHDSSSMFAAAVISGALSPAPQTLEELFTRIGTSPIPDEFAARLKDLLA